MTALDHELMSRICPLEYIYHVFKVKGAMSVNLSNFTNRFNQVRRRAHCIACLEPRLIGYWPALSNRSTTGS